MRDPLLTLGCRDPVERIEALKANDPYRQRIAEFFKTWWEAHGDKPIKASELAERCGVSSTRWIKAANSSRERLERWPGRVPPASF